MVAFQYKQDIKHDKEQKQTMNSYNSDVKIYLKPRHWDSAAAFISSEITKYEHINNL